jgi:hypothetical protein
MTKQAPLLFALILLFSACDPVFPESSPQLELSPTELPEKENPIDAFFGGLSETLEPSTTVEMAVFSRIWGSAWEAELDHRYDTLAGMTKIDRILEELRGEQAAFKSYILQNAMIESYVFYSGVFLGEESDMLGSAAQVARGVSLINAYKAKAETLSEWLLGLGVEPGYVFDEAPYLAELREELPELMRKPTD